MRKVHMIATPQVAVRLVYRQRGQKLGHLPTLQFSISHKQATPDTPSCMANRSTHSLLVACGVWALVASAQSQNAAVQMSDLEVNDAAPPTIYAGVLNQAFDTQRPALEECQEVHPGAGGDLTLRLWISARQVIRVTAETHLEDAALEECARAQIRRFSLPPEVPDGGVSVRFTLVFPPHRAPPAAVPPAAVPSTAGSAEPPSDTNAAPNIDLTFRRPSETLQRLITPALFAECMPGNISLDVTVTRTTIRARALEYRMGNDVRCYIERVQALSNQAPFTRERNRVRIVYE